MSLRAHRVNTIEYGATSDLFFGSKFRTYLELEEIILKSDNEFSEEIDIRKLKEFLVDLENGEIELDKDIIDEIEEYNFLDYLDKELNYAETYNEDFLTYHIF